MNPVTLAAHSTATAVDTLRSRIQGEVLTPADQEYDVARQAWNLYVDQRPAMVAMPESAGDVARIVRVARDHGLRVAPQAPGTTPTRSTTSRTRSC